MTTVMQSRLVYEVGVYTASRLLNSKSYAHFGSTITELIDWFRNPGQIPVYMDVCYALCLPRYYKFITAQPSIAVNETKESYSYWESRKVNNSAKD